MKQLNRIVTAYLDFAENMTLRHIPLTMQDWEKRLNSFIEMFDYGILQDAGKVTAEIAKLHADAANLFFQLVARRYEKHCTIITTNSPFSKWSEISGSATLANAVLDRLLHHSEVISIKGPSYRLKEKRALLEAQAEE